MKNIYDHAHVGRLKTEFLWQLIIGRGIKNTRCMRSKCSTSTYVWEERYEFLHVEANTLQSSEISSVHPLDGVSTDDEAGRNSDYHVSHSTHWRYVWTYPSVQHPPQLHSIKTTIHWCIWSNVCSYTAEHKK